MAAQPPPGGLGEEKPPPWIATESADIFFALLIVVNALVLGVDIEVSLRNGGDSGPVLFWIQFGFVMIFVIELFLRVKAFGFAFFNAYRNPSGLFDAIIVSTSVAEYVVTLCSEGGESPLQAVSAMRIFRLLRIARVARLVNICPELSMLISGLAASIQAVFWVFCLLFVIMYICALICAMELGRTDDEELRGYFGSVTSSFWTHFMVVTLEGYPGVAAAAGQASWLWYLYIVGFIVFSNVVLMNLVTGIVCESIVTKAQDDELQSHVYREESRKFEEVMSEILVHHGFTREVELCFEDFERVVRAPEVREALNVLEICMEVEDRVMWDILDEDGSGKLSLDEFISGLLRLRGSKDTLHSLTVQSDIIRGGRLVREAFEEAEAGASRYAASLCGALQSKLLQRLSELPAGASGQDRDAARGAGRRQRDGRHRTRRTCQPEALHGVAPPLEAEHGAAPPSEEARVAAGAAVAPPWLTRAAEDVQPGVDAAAAAAPTLGTEEAHAAPAAVSATASLPLGAEESQAGTGAAATASRAPGAEDLWLAADAAASRPSRREEEGPPAALEVHPLASRPSRGDLEEDANANLEHHAPSLGTSRGEPTAFDLPNGSMGSEAAAASTTAPQAATSEGAPATAATAVAAPAAAPSGEEAASPPQAPAAAPAAAAATAAASAGSCSEEIAAPATAAATAPAAASSSLRAEETAVLVSAAPAADNAAAASDPLAPEGVSNTKPVQAASTDERVLAIVADLESSSSEARQTLSRLGEDLASSRKRIRELEAKLARREASGRAHASEHVDGVVPSWSSQCSARGLVGLEGVSARELQLLPGVEPRHRQTAAKATAAAPPVGASDGAVGAAASSAAWARQRAAGGELEKALRACRRQADAPPVVARASASAGASTSSGGRQAGRGTAAAAATAGQARAVPAHPARAIAAATSEATAVVADGAPRTAAVASAALASTTVGATAPEEEPRRAVGPRGEHMATRRRLEATYASLASPKVAAAPAAGRPRGGAPRQRFLNTFHGHSVDFQAIAKAATHESSDEELGGGSTGARVGG